MGYRSEVMISTTEEGYEKLVAMCDEANVEHPLVSRSVEPEHVEHIEGCVVFGWEQIEWYDEAFAEVAAVMQAIEELSGEGVPARFVRIGEDAGDIETRGDADGLAVFPEPSMSIELFYT